MRDFRDAKAMAQTLRAALDAIGFKTTVSQSLELIAQAFGVADWNTLSAAIGSGATAVPDNAPPPPAAESARSAGNPPNPLPSKQFSGRLESAIQQAIDYAKERKHERTTVEHLLLFLLDDADTSRVMKASGVNLDELRKKLTDYLGSNVKSQAADSGGDSQPTLGLQRVLQHAIIAHEAAVSNGVRIPVTCMSVLVAMFSEKDSHAVKLFNEQGVTRMDVVGYLGRRFLFEGQPRGS